MKPKKERRLYEEIKKRLETEVFGKRWTSRGKVFNPLNLETQVKRAIEVTYEEVEQYFKNHIDGIETKRGEGRGKLRKSIEKLPKKENLLERVFVASVENVFNQFNLISGLTREELDGQTKHMNIDLVVTNEKQVIEEMIELKYEENRDDNPLSAMLQLIMYYFIFCRAKDKDSSYPDVVKKVKLTILAPKEYYQQYRKGCDKKILSPIAQWASREIETAVVSFQKVDVEKEDLKSAKSILGKFNSIFKTRETIQ